MLKALFVLEIFKFLSWLFDYVKNGLIRKLRLTSKFMTSQAGQQLITIHILSNISRGKEDQTIKFGQLIEYNMRNSFIGKSDTTCGMFQNLFLLYVQVEVYQNILKLRF